MSSSARPLPPFIGIIPAAGQGRRLRPFVGAKELLPVRFAPAPEGGLQPLLAIEHSLDALRRAGVPQAYVVIADWKLVLVQALGDGRDYGVDLAWLHRAVPRGLADAVHAGWPWVADRPVALVLPDTWFEPADALAQVCARVTAGADLCLGVFPTAHPERLGPVRLGPDGAVREVLDKPAQTDLKNTWGLAAWRPRFTALLHAQLSEAEPDALPPLGQLFDAATRAGLQVEAVEFPAGRYVDVGTVQSLADLMGERGA